MQTVYQVFYRLKDEYYQYYYGEYPTMDDATAQFDIIKNNLNMDVDCWVTEIAVPFKNNQWFLSRGDWFLKSIEQDIASLVKTYTRDKSEAWIFTVQQEAELIANQWGLDIKGEYITNEPVFTAPDDSDGNDAVFVDGDIPVTIPEHDDNVSEGLEHENL